MTRVKICGCMRVADAIGAAEAGADFVGVVFAASRRRVSPEEASQIVRALGAPLRELDQMEPPPMHPGRFETIDAWFDHGAQALERLLTRKRPLVVGVFEDQDPEEVNEIADETGIDLIQLSGSEHWSDCLLVNRPAIKVLRQRSGMLAPEILDYIEPGGAIAFMLDPSRGSGTPGDWAAASAVAMRVPLWLAGGLTAQNVARAIRDIDPWAVDVSSGVETDGAKDAAKIAAFVRAVRDEDRALRPVRDMRTRSRTDRSSDLSRRPEGTERKSSPRLVGFPYRGGYRYHVVLSAAKGTRPFASADWARRAVTDLEGVAAATSFTLEAYCVMPDHVHLLVAGDAALDSNLPRFVHRYKQALGFAFKQATGQPLWHRSYYDHVLRENEPALVHAAYILANPVSAGCVGVPGAWPYSGPENLIQELAGEDRSEDLSVRIAELALEMDRAIERQEP